MKHLDTLLTTIFIATFFVAIAIWTTQDESCLLGPLYIYFFNNINGLDLFIFIGICIYLWAFVSWIAYQTIKSIIGHYLNYEQINEPFFLYWLVSFPLFFLVGIILYKLGIVTKFHEWTWILGTSIVIIVLVKYSIKEKDALHAYWIIISSLYIVLIATSFIPIKKMNEWIGRDNGYDLYYISEQQLYFEIKQNNDNIQIRIGKDLNSESSILILQYYTTIHKKKEIPDGSIILKVFDEKIYVQTETGEEIRIINDAGYKIVDYCNKDFIDYEYTISRHNFYAQKEIYGMNASTIEVKKLK